MKYGWTRARLAAVKVPVSRDVNGNGGHGGSLPEMRLAVSYVNMSCNNAHRESALRHDADAPSKAHLQEVDPLPI